MKRLAALAFAGLWLPAAALTTFGAPFSDHAVLQRDAPLKVWGTDEPHRSVRVDFAGRRAETIASPEGRWSVTLDPIPAGGPHTLTAAGSTTATLTNILVGDVWICSGQSNMEWPLKLSEEGLRAATQAPALGRIRLLRVGRSESADPRSDFAEPAAWAVPTVASAEDFSAVAWYFGTTLHEELDVPIGLIQAAWGGTRIEPWISRAGFSKAPVLRELYESQMARIAEAPAQIAEWEKREAEWKKIGVHRDPGRDPATAGWLLTEFDDSEWAEIPVPSTWAAAGHAMNGAAWYRFRLEVPESWRGQDLEINLGPIDDQDDTWFNGERIGGLNDPDNDLTWAVKRIYPVASRFVRTDKNVLAIRVWDRMGDGGIVGPAHEIFVRNVVTGERLELPATARFRVEKSIPLPPISYWELHQRYFPWIASPAAQPTRIYNGMIAPLGPLSVRGAIWYQGESNAEEARAYARLLPALIADWRQTFHQPLMPFYFVQLAAYGPNAPGVESHWARLREAQRSALSVPGTGMVVTIDTGDPFDIHPRNKRPVGERLAKQALAKHYGIEPAAGTCEGPLAIGAALEEQGIRVWFAAVGTGLELRETESNSFEVAGPDGVYRPATATAQGDTLLLTAGGVAEPRSIRYAWANSPRAALFNVEGFPASPFRLDIK